MNSSFLSSLQTWARRATAKSVQAPASIGNEADAPRYRLRAWPELPDEQRIAPIYRLLSVMTVRCVTRAWMLEQSRLSPSVVDALIASLQASGELVLDTTPEAPRMSRPPGSQRDLLLALA